ncbi:MAG: slipin family protein [Candidatus Coatesbacteria bacterium]|nr:slipin family protein [Candidatus Coatesbacteria bacterium]
MAEVAAILLFIFAIFIFFLLVSTIKIIKQYERGIRFTLGKYSGIMEPGLNIIIPVIHSYARVDVRIKAVDVPEQIGITKDNISVGINAVIYYKVSDASRAILEVEHFNYAVSQLAQTTMRNVVGEVELDELLSSRDRISARIREVVDEATDPWGIKVDAVELKDITLPENMKRTLAKQAEAERERRAVIIKAEGEVIAAKNMAKAAEILTTNPGALHLRTLQTLNDVASDQSNTIIFAVPLEVLRSFETFNKNFNKEADSIKPVPPAQLKE